MVSVHEAVHILHSVTGSTGKAAVELSQAVGRVLAEPVVADRDFPPFNRVAMDGIAVNSRVVHSGQIEFTVEATQPAGSPAETLTNEKNCIEVMTGAMLPHGTDAVIRYEDVEMRGKLAVVKIRGVSKGMNIHARADDAKQGDVLLLPDQFISPAEVALLAAVGKEKVWVKTFPKTAVISSGDELVKISAEPEPYQIRRSNVYALQAAMKQVAWHADLFHLADQKMEAERILEDLLTQYELLILSGGVSKGKFDFIPAALRSLGVEKKFHQVSQRPGKPFWFGCRHDGRIVFALPGNPVSTYVCFYRYILPWMKAQMGVAIKPKSAILTEAVTFTPNLTYFLQVSTFMEEGRLMARPIPGGGSGDFVNLKEVDGFLELPAEKSVFNAGEAYPFFGFRQF